MNKFHIRNLVQIRSDQIKSEILFNRNALAYLTQHQSLYVKNNIFKIGCHDSIFYNMYYAYNMLINHMNSYCSALVVKWALLNWIFSLYVNHKQW